nr:hypothetical protein [Tanacetum cinerariifolium]
MACSLPHIESEVEALVQKLIDENKGRQNTILDLALQFENSSIAKDNLRKAYEKCTDISQESRALIDTFLKECSDKHYELNLSMQGCQTRDFMWDRLCLCRIGIVGSDWNRTIIPICHVFLVSMYEKAAKLEKQMVAKLAWLLEKYYYHSQESVDCSSSQSYLYLSEKELHQLHLDEEALRETLEEQAMDVKAREEKIRQKQADDDEFFFGIWDDIDNFLKKEKLEQVVVIVKFCSPNMLGDITVTLKDLSGTIPRTIHYKVLDVGSYRKDITVGAAMILANVSVFTPKPSQHYLNITMRNVIEVFCKDTVIGSGSG